MEDREQTIVDLFEAFNGPERYVIVRGGARAGKTFAILRYLLYLALVERNKRISVVSITYPHLKRGAYRDMRQILDGLPIRYKENKADLMLTFQTGSFIEFFSVDRSDKVRGAQRDYLFINEANLINASDFNELDIRTSKKIFMDFNPTGRFWLNDFYDSQTDKSRFIALKRTYLDNPYLSPEQVSAIESRKDDEEWYKVFGLGEWGRGSGRAWWSFQTINQIPKGAKLVAVGVDVGFTVSPSAVVELWVMGDEYFAHEVFYQVIELDKLATFLQRYTRQAVVVDSAHKNLIQQLRQSFGVPAYPCRKLDLAVSFELLNARKVFVTASSGNLLKEAFGLQFTPEKKLLGASKHAVDALRYALDTLYPIIQGKLL